MSQEIKQLVEEVARDFEDFKANHSKQLDELQAGKADVVLSEKVDRINDSITEMLEKQDDLVKQEKLDEIKEDIRAMKERVFSPEFTGGDPPEDEHTKAFIDHIRKHSPSSEANLTAAEEKAVTIGTATAGGHAVPAPIAQEVFQKVLEISPIVGAVRTTNVESPLYERLVDERGAASGWAGETTTRSETGTPVLQQVTFTHGELYAVPKTSQWALNDMMFDVTGWLTGSVADEFAYQLAAAVTTGSGTNRPTGFIGTPEANDDGASPRRTFGQIEYFPTGAAAGFQKDYLTGSPQGDPWAVFVDLLTGIKPQYLPNAQFTMRRSTEAVLRKLRDQDANYYWAPSVAAGFPNTLWGYNIIPNENMAAVTTNAIPVAFGDFMAGYELIVIQGMRLIRDDVTSKGHVLFYFAQRFGGKTTNDEAVKCIKCATS